MTEFFLSYVHEYRHLAAEIKKVLEDNEMEAFLAHEDITVSYTWVIEIEKALNRCSGLIAIVTPGFAQSWWANQEVGYARGRRKPIVPLAFETKLDDLPGFLASIQGMRLTEETVVASTKRALDIFNKNKQNYEIQTYASTLLDEISVTELLLTSHQDSSLDPDASQMLRTIAVQSDKLLRLSKFKPAEELNLKKELDELSECLLQIVNYPYSVSFPFEFAKVSQDCLAGLNKVKEILRTVVEPRSDEAFVETLKSNLSRLMTDWEFRVRWLKSGQSEMLRQAFWSHAFDIYPLASHPEAARLELEEQLISLAKALHELSSTEDYFGSWLSREGMLQRIEQKFSECEQLVKSLNMKISSQKSRT